MVESADQCWSLGRSAASLRKHKQECYVNHHHYNYNQHQNHQNLSRLNHQTHHLLLFDREGFFDHPYPCTEFLKHVMETPQMVPAAEVGFPVERNMTVWSQERIVVVWKGNGCAFLNLQIVLMIFIDILLKLRERSTIWTISPAKIERPNSDRRLEAVLLDGGLRGTSPKRYGWNMVELSYHCSCRMISAECCLRYLMCGIWMAAWRWCRSPCLNKS